MKPAGASLITTVFNEETSIESFLKSVCLQTLTPFELIIVDGGSKDKTLDVIKQFLKNNQSQKFKVKIFIKKGNRSIGRNTAIKNSEKQIILCTDAGCTLDKNWIKNIYAPFLIDKPDVVAGYYRGNAKNNFQKALIPYVLVMEDKIDKENFLPATRSMAFTKSIWKEAGKFNTNLSHNEDYAFANKLKLNHAKIVFAKNAVVNWTPRKNTFDSFKMFFRFAYGDGESSIIRNKVLLIYARYFFYIYLLILTVLEKSIFLYFLVIIIPLIYIFWSVKKNYKYV